MKGFLKIPVLLTAFLLFAFLMVIGDTSDTHTVTLEVGNNQPFIVSVEVPSSFDPTEDAIGHLWINFTAEDGDGNGGGANELADGSARVILSKSGEATRIFSGCAASDVDGSANRTKYDCDCAMWYFDAAGSWVVNVSINDSVNAKGFDDDSTLTVNVLTALKMSPTSVSFGSVYLGQTDVAATDDPIVLNNTGNTNFTVVKVTGLDLQGETTATEYIFAGNFSVNTADAANGEALVNNTAVTVPSSTLPKGNHSVGDGTGQESLYYYLEIVPPSISNQNYSTTGLGAWTVAAFTS